MRKGKLNGYLKMVPAVLLVVVMLAGCGGSATPSSSAPPAATSAAASQAAVSEAASPAATSEAASPAATSDAATPAASSAAATPATTVSNASGNGVTFSFWSGSGDPAYQQFIDDWSAQTGNKIEYTSYAGLNYLEAVRVAAAAGTQPNMWAWWDGEITADFLNKGQSLDLTPYAEQYNWANKFVPWTLDHFKRNGKLGGMPVGFSALVYIYRKDLYDQYGLSVPTTYDEWVANCQTLADNNIAPVALTAQDGADIMRIFDVFLDKFCGPDMHEKLLEKTVSWNSPEVVRAFAEMKMYADHNFFPEGYISMRGDEAYQFIYTGTACGTVEGGWFGQSLIQDNQDSSLYNAFAIPTDNGGTRFDGWSDSLVFGNVGTKEQQDAAVAFANWFSDSTTVTADPNRTYPYTPATVGFDFSSMDPIKQMVIGIMNNGTAISPLDQSFNGELANTFFEIQSNVLLGTTTPEDAAKGMQDAIDSGQQ